MKSFKAFIATTSLLLTSPSLMASELTLPSVEDWANGSKQTEVILTETIRQQMLGLQKSVGDVVGKKLRGTHAKGQCTLGTFTVFERPLSATLPSQKNKEEIIKSGIFSQSGTYEARIRFANASSKIAPDQVPDLRSISIAIKNGEGKEQHFAMNNSPRFQIPTLEVFSDVITFFGVQAQVGEDIGAALEQLGKVIVDQLLKGIESPTDEQMAQAAQKAKARVGGVAASLQMAKEDQKIARSFDSQTYWSGTAFALGQKEDLSAKNVVKFGAYPCSREVVIHTDYLEGENELLSNDEASVLSENYLFEDLDSKINVKGQPPICFQFFVQFMDETDEYNPEKATEMVEDPSKAWKGVIHTIASLEITDRMSPEECDSPENAINPNIVNIDTFGLGQINRGRTPAEKSSAEARP